MEEVCEIIPRKVIKMEDELTLAKPTEIIKSVEEKLSNTPDEISVNLILTGNGAKRYHFVMSILASIYPELNEEEIHKYLLRSGVERELERITNIWNQYD